MSPKAGAPDLLLQKARVLSIADEVEAWLGLDWLRVVHLFNENENGEDQMAHAVAKPAYRYAEITWNLYTVMAAEDRTLYLSCIHEYVHVLTGPIDKHLALTKAHVLEALETSVENVAQAIGSALLSDPPEALRRKTHLETLG